MRNHNIIYEVHDVLLNIIINLDRKTLIYIPDAGNRGDWYCKSFQMVAAGESMEKYSFSRSNCVRIAHFKRIKIKFVCVHALIPWGTGFRWIACVVRRHPKRNEANGPKRKVERKKKIK